MVDDRQVGELEEFLRSRQQVKGAPQQRLSQMKAVRCRIQVELIQSPEFKGLDGDQTRSIVEQRAWEMVQQAAEGDARALVLSSEEKAEMVRRILASMFGLGAIDHLVHDHEVTEIMVNGPNAIFVERRGTNHKAESGVATDRFGNPLTFDDGTELLNTIERIVAPINRKVDESSPIVDARIPKTGSRVNIVLSPISLDGHAITIRNFPEPITMEKLVNIKSVPEWLAELLQRMVEARYNIVVSGGTGSGKTTFLNALSQYIPEEDRVITVEDSAELQLQQVRNLVRLESRPPNLEGKGAIEIRQLVKASLRMRPDRIIVGEVRGGEALDMLQAMNTGHDGSMTTGHANASEDMISRLETMVMMSDVKLPLEAVRRQIASAVDFIIQLSRLPDKSRKVTQLTEVVAGANGDVVTRTLAMRVAAGELEPTGEQISRMEKFMMKGRWFDSPVITWTEEMHAE